MEASISLIIAFDETREEMEVTDLRGETHGDRGGDSGGSDRKTRGKCRC